MTKKINHLHASPVFLSLGLLAVMAFAIIMGVSQINQSQITSSEAKKLSGQTAAQKCTLNTLDPRNPSKSKDTVVGESIASSCTESIIKTVHKDWIHASNTTSNSPNKICTCLWKKGAITSCSPQDCKANPQQSDAVKSWLLLKGTYTYCNWGRVTWYLSSGGSGTKVAKSAHCITLTH